MRNETVVFVPPLLCDGRVFQDQIAALSVHHPVMVLPTTGAETIAALGTRALEAAPGHFALVGAGFGATIALEMIQQAPERVSRIALINPVAQADTSIMAAERETQIIAAKADRFADVVAHEMDLTRLYQGASVADHAPVLQDMAQRVGPEAYIAASRAMQKRKDQQGILRKIRQPALVISGAADPQLPIRRQEFIAEMIPYADHEVIAEAGMLPSLEAPGQVTAILQKWVTQPLVLR